MLPVSSALYTLSLPYALPFSFWRQVFSVSSGWLRIYCVLKAHKQEAKNFLQKTKRI